MPVSRTARLFVFGITLGLGLVLWACSPAALMPRLPAAPVAVAPASGASIDTVYPEFLWEPPASATSYVLTLTPTRTAGGPPLTIRTSRTRFLLGSPLVVGEEYSWFVAGQSLAGVGPGSEVRRFRVTSNTRPAAPLLLDPPDGQPLLRANPRLTWRPRDGQNPGEWQIQIETTDGDILINPLVGNNRSEEFLLFDELGSSNFARGSLSFNTDI